MSTTLHPPTRSAAPPPAKPPRDVWARRLAIGLPIIGLLLVVIVANQIGGILIARDLRDEYEGLVEEGRAVLSQVDEQPGDAERAPTAEQAAPPDVRPELAVAASLTEFAIELDVKEVPAWAAITFNVTNDGKTPHDLSIDGGPRTPMLEPGATATLEYEADGSGAIRMICTVPGHEAAGMHLALPIAGEDKPATGAPAPAPAEDGTASNAATPDNAAAYEGAKPAIKLRNPVAPQPLRGTVHNITWTVEEKVVQIAKDVYQEMWTFNGQAPGPTLRVKVGDTVNLTLRNPKKAKLGHSIDFHASQVAWNDEMRTINPGESLQYSFTATHAGVFMYHCGTAPALHHIGNGMYGAIIVEPKEGLEPVDKEFVFVQGDFYLGPQGEPGDLTKMSAGAASPDLIVWNGVANQYADHPIEVGVGERIRTWVLNAGPSADSSYHVVGTIFDTVVKEGVALRRGNAGGWGAQAMDLSPAQGGYAEFTLAEDGLYPIVTHAFNHVGRGALGLFKAGTGGKMPEGGH